jgi:hypothetical protein
VAKVGAVLLVAVGVAVLGYAFAEADLLQVALWWAFGSANPPTEIGIGLALGIIGGLLVIGGATLWKNAGRA